jgi:uncharacterized glyoxalase superfamily protein PhnB
MKNRSVPTDTILPHVVYQDVPAAISYLSATFGFEEHYRYGDPGSGGAQMHLGNAWIQLRSAREDGKSPAQAGCWTQSLSIFVEDVDEHYARAKSAGATFKEELHVTVYGERQYVAVDPEGHSWLFSQHAVDVSPAEWGARLPTNGSR